MHRRRRLIHPLTGIAFPAILLLAAVAPVLAKEGIEARLDAPIARDTPGGTELLVGLTATVLDGSVARMVEGTPFYIRVTGPAGDTTRALTTPDPETGHYSARVVVPASGIAGIEIGIAGSTDLPVLIAGEPIVAGGISPATAQAAPPVVPAPAVASAPVASPVDAAAAPTAPVADAAGASVAPVDSPAAMPAPAGAAPLPWIAAIGIAAGVIAVVGAGVLLAARRLRDGRRPEGSGRIAGG